MKIIKKIGVLIVMFSLLSFVFKADTETYSLTVRVKDLRNSEGVLQFSIYNKDGSVPDEHFEKFYKQKTGQIVHNTAQITFENLPKGRYAVNILHDENKDGKIDKGFILPTEGVGFSNFTNIGPFNRPNFKKASFELNANKNIAVIVKYF